MKFITRCFSVSMLMAFSLSAMAGSKTHASNNFWNPPSMFCSYMIAANGNLADGNRVVFGPEYSNSVDINDAIKINNPGENFGILRDGQTLAVETRLPLEAGDTIFYKMTNFATQTYKLMLIPQQLQEASVDAILIDRFLNTRTLVSLIDTTRLNIPFTSDPASKASNRLLVVFLAKLKALPVTMTEVNAARQADNSILLQWKSENEVSMMEYVAESSADGRVFEKLATLTAKNGSDGKARYNVTDMVPHSGDNYYRVKGIGRSGSVNYSAIVKVAPASVKAEISVYPNPVVNKTMQLKFTNQPQGWYTVEIADASGRIMYSSNMEVTTTNAVKSITVNQQLVPGLYRVIVKGTSGRPMVTQVMVQ